MNIVPNHQTAMPVLRASRLRATFAPLRTTGRALALVATLALVAASPVAASTISAGVASIGSLSSTGHLVTASRPHQFDPCSGEPAPC